jgi:hypothetical protein
VFSERAVLGYTKSNLNGRRELNLEVQLSYQNAGAVATGQGIKLGKRRIAMTNLRQSSAN